MTMNPKLRNPMLRRERNNPRNPNDGKMEPESLDAIRINLKLSEPVKHPEFLLDVLFKLEPME